MGNRLQARCLLSDGEMASMFLKGVTSVEIGKKAGISKERVRQRLGSYFKTNPNEVPQGTTEKATARILAVGPGRLAKLRKAGRVPSLPYGRSYLYPEASLRLLKDILANRCKACGKVIPAVRAHYCDECRSQKQRLKYTVMSEKARRKHIDLCRAWEARHPDKVRESSIKSKEKLRSRSVYTVVTRNALGIPVGTEVRVVGFDRETYRLVLEDGRRLHNRCVRRALKS